MAEQTTKQMGPLQAVLTLIFSGVALWYFLGGGLEKHVAYDAAKQYEIAMRNEDLSQACLQAGLVSSSLLSAKDEERYRKWKEIEKYACDLSAKKTEEELEKKMWPDGKPEWLR